MRRIQGSRHALPMPMSLPHSSRGRHALPSRPMPMWTNPSGRSLVDFTRNGLTHCAGEIARAVQEGIINHPFITERALFAVELHCSHREGHNPGIQILTSVIRPQEISWDGFELNHLLDRSHRLVDRPMNVPLWSDKEARDRIRLRAHDAIWEIIKGSVRADGIPLGYDARYFIYAELVGEVKPPLRAELRNATNSGEIDAALKSHTRALISGARDIFIDHPFIADDVLIDVEVCRRPEAVDRGLFVSFDLWNAGEIMNLPANPEWRSEHQSMCVDRVAAEQGHWKPDVHKSRRRTDARSAFSALLKDALALVSPDPFRRWLAIPLHRA